MQNKGFHIHIYLFRNKLFNALRTTLFVIPFIIHVQVIMMPFALSMTRDELQRDKGELLDVGTEKTY